MRRQQTKPSGATSGADKSGIPAGAMVEDWVLPAMERQCGRALVDVLSGGQVEMALGDEIRSHARRAFDLADALAHGPDGVLAAGELRGKLTGELSWIQAAFEVRAARSRNLARRVATRPKVSQAEKRRWRAIAGEAPGAAGKAGEDTEHGAAVRRAYAADALLLSRGRDAVKSHEAGNWPAVMELLDGIQKWCRGGLKALPVRAGDRAVCRAALAELRRPEKGAKAMPAGNGDGQKVVTPRGKPGWTQGTVEAEIRKLADCARREFTTLRRRTPVSDATREKLRIQFGRNEIARKLGCSGAMVSKSKAWRKIATVLGVAGRKPGVGRGEQVGLEIADEQAAEGTYREEESKREAIDQRIDRNRPGPQDPADQAELAGLVAQQGVEDACDEKAARRWKRRHRGA